MRSWPRLPKTMVTRRKRRKYSANNLNKKTSNRRAKKTTVFTLRTAMSFFRRIQILPWIATSGQVTSLNSTCRCYPTMSRPATTMTRAKIMVKTRLKTMLRKKMLLKARQSQLSNRCCFSNKDSQCLRKTIGNHYSISKISTRSTKYNQKR